MAYLVANYRDSVGCVAELPIPADRKRSYWQDHNLTSEIMQGYTCYQYALRIYRPQF
ncbi:hypothetical protein PXH59_04975 [Xenorhabdus sp. SF857]|uniref:hypothetical protein n=1 Tax=Xenorhabdus bakwenae TaxID=3026967 RepID=UPI002557E96A|nr:hypothetical protein [Xenorhabdus sp. SF857]WFQ80493.1 hypothetical protein PXH59_04975 [Xenorhabdus sp. SF857]